MSENCKRNVFKFRAEFISDVEELLCFIPDATTEIKQGIVFPDVQVTLTTTLDKVQLLSIMGRIPDGHVMRETLANADEYTGERRYPESEFSIHRNQIVNADINPERN